MLLVLQGISLRKFLYLVIDPPLDRLNHLSLVQVGLEQLSLYHCYGFRVFLRVCG
jgi:hypothetical protein